MAVLKKLSISQNTIFKRYFSQWLVRNSATNEPRNLGAHWMSKLDFKNNLRENYLL